MINTINVSLILGVLNAIALFVAVQYLIDARERIELLFESLELSKSKINHLNSENSGNTEHLLKLTNILTAMSNTQDAFACELILAKNAAKFANTRLNAKELQEPRLSSRIPLKKPRKGKK